VAKYAPDGRPLWAKRFGGPYDDLGKALAVDASGDVFVTGQFQASAGFGDGTMTCAGSYDIFLARLSGADGRQIWAKGLGGTSIDTGDALALDDTGNVYLTGSFRGTVAPSRSNSHPRLDRRSRCE